MRRSIQLSIPEPCTESWDAMTPRGCGRHCTSCDKTVVDFTMMSDGEIVRFIEKQDSQVCGHVAASQLNRDIVVPRRPWPGVRYFFAVTLPALLLSVKATAQHSNKVPVETQATQDRQAITAHISPSEISGQVVDIQGAPVPFATIFETDTKNGVSADAEGNFQIRLGSGPGRITISSTNYLTQTKSVQGPKVFIVLERQEDIVGGDVIVVTMRKRPRKELKAARRNEAAKGIAPSIKPYPNPVPADNDLNIETTNLDAGNYLIELYSLAGQQLRKTDVAYDGKSTRMRLSTAGVPAGTYILRVVNEKTGKALSEQVVLR